MGGRLAYVMSRFPHLPETFILREMIELERLGWEVALYPLVRQAAPVVHAAARPWLARAQFLPFCSPAGVAAHGRACLRRPGLYFATLGQAVWENRLSPNFLLRALALWPPAVYAARHMLQAGVTHVHAHYATHPALLAWMIHRLTGLSYSLTVHAHDIFVRKAMLATKVRAAAFVVAISDYNREYLAGQVGDWVRAKTHVIHCGVAPDQYPPRLHRPEPGDRFEIITVGSLQPYKGHRYLLQACAVLQQRGVPFRCRIIGGGAERAALERLSAQAGLTAQVEWLGPRPQEDVTQLLPGAHCYVQPSIITPAGKMEGIPVALMEALACALPVVATAISGVPELVRAGETGYLVPPADPVALAEALQTVYAAPAQAARLGQAGRQLVEQEFNLPVNVARLAELFQRVTHGS